MVSPAHSDSLIDRGEVDPPVHQALGRCGVTGPPSWNVIPEVMLMQPNKHMLVCQLSMKTGL